MKSGDDDVVEIVMSELEMVSLDTHEVYLVGIHQNFEPNFIIFVEVGVFYFEECIVLVKFPEPFAFLWVDHGVFGEHDQQNMV